VSFLDKVKRIMDVPEDEYYDEVDEEESGEAPRPPQRDRARAKTREREYGVDFDEYEAPPSRAPAPATDGRNKVLNIHATTQLQVVLVKPERFDDAPSIADHLNSRRTVVVNLESTSKEIARRLIDFLSGVAYANSGQLKRVANSTFLITPYNVDIMGEALIDELENNGLYL